MALFFAIWVWFGEAEPKPIKLIFHPARERQVTFSVQLLSSLSKDDREANWEPPDKQETFSILLYFLLTTGISYTRCGI
jgi:hypothetical protein